MSGDFDLLRELEAVVVAFNERHIRYAVAGGFAVALYGFVRATKDMDVLCHPDDLRKAGEALGILGYKQYADPWTFRESRVTLVRWMKSFPDHEWFYVVDLLIPPADHLNWLQEAGDVEWRSSVSVRVVRKEHLVEMKRARNSPVDQEDIRRLSGET